MNLSDEQINEITELMKREPVTQNLSIASINEDINEGELIINKEYQRNYLQTPKEASKFVESVFLGCVIPGIQIFEEKDGIKEILDGQQRTTSLVDFLNNKYSLTGLQKLPYLNGFFYKELPKQLKRKFKGYNISTATVKYDKENDEYKFFVFERLNTGSKQLTKQEIRNCIYRGSLLNLAKEISEIDNIKDFLNKANLTNKRFESTEFILRLISVCNTFPNIKSTASSTINAYLIENKDIDDNSLIEIKSKICNTFNLLINSIGWECFINKKNESTRKETINKVNIEPVFINLYKYFEKNNIILNSDKIKQAISNTINNNEKYLIISNKGTDTRKCILEKFCLFNEIIGKNIDIETDRNRLFSLRERIILWNNESSKLRGDKKPKCALCKNEILNFEDCEVDHTIPWSKGGQTNLSNAQLVHSYCNKIKSNK